MGNETQVDENVCDVVTGVRVRSITAFSDSSLETKLEAEVGDTVNVDESTVLDPELEEMVAVTTVDTTDSDSSGKLLLDLSDVGYVGNQVKLEEEINEVLSAGRTVSRTGSWGWAGRVASRSRGSSRGASVREVAALAIADRVRGGADALFVVLVRDKSVLASEVARVVDVTEGLSMLRVVALLVTGLALDQVGEEIMGFVFTTKQVGNVLSNGVVPAEVGENRQAETKIKMTGDQRFVIGENVKKFHVKIKANAYIDETTLQRSLAEGMTGCSEGNGRQKEWCERRNLHCDKERN